jgi:predicted DNA-binding transcriptional regulator AlpA
VTSTEERYLTDAEVAQKLNIAVGSIRTWRFRNVGPRWVKLCRCVRYPESAVEAFIARGMQPEPQA